MVGNFVGHAIPGAFMLLFGAFYFARFLGALRHSAVVDSSEANQCLLHWQGVVVFTACALGIVVECGGPVLLGAGCFYNAQHEVMYAAFMLPSAAAVLEAANRLPSGAHKFGASIALLVECALFHAHSKMFKEPEATMHVVLAIWSMAGCVAAFAAAANPSMVVAHAAWIGTFLGQGGWFYYIGFTLFPVFVDPLHPPPRGASPLSAHTVVLIACAELLAVTGLMGCAASVAINWRQASHRASPDERESMLASVSAADTQSERAAEVEPAPCF